MLLELFDLLFSQNGPEYEFTIQFMGVKIQTADIFSPTLPAPSPEDQLISGSDQ